MATYDDQPVPAPAALAPRAVDLHTPLRSLIDPKAARALADHRGVHTYGDLLWFLPRRYIDVTRPPRPEDYRPGQYVVLFGVVTASQKRPMRNRRGQLSTLRIATQDGASFALVFFKGWYADKMPVGTSGIFAGRLERARGGGLELTHPEFHLTQGGPEAAAELLGRPIIPVYLDVKGLPSWTLARLIQDMHHRVGDVPDPIPAPVRARRDLPGLREAFRLIHLPETVTEYSRGLRRLRYEEALITQVVLGRRRRSAAAAPAVPRHARERGLLEAFDARLPFTLTDGQRQVGDDIAADLTATHPMHRLLQGEVGSGKTIVALRAMLAVIDAGGQAALLAPTEVLAAQHHRSITALLGDLAEGGLLGGAAQGTRVALLTGSLPAAARHRALLQAASGEAGIVVGTHALIQQHVAFADLGLIVVDEQHRFGVEQRDALRGKATASPHMLVMTATPIPRTVAMTVFGDMEVSTLRELPRGRAPIATHVVDNPRWYARTWTRVAEEVAQGRQVYVVCPRIGDDGAEDDPEAARGTWRDDADTDADAEGPPGEAPPPEAARAARGVLEVVEELRGNPDLAGVRIDLLHGRLPADRKDAVMSAFARGEVDVLVATTVIEVGVDVPNATVMVVLDADRFGVSQLHQLRGRVGRGGLPGLALLVADDPPDGAGERLRAVASTTDGFELAELDLRDRREGDVLGARQSGGRSALRVLRVARGGDRDLIEAARADATDLLDHDPDLDGHRLLRIAVAERVDDEQAAFLERG